MSPARILVVDDDETQLEDMGYTVSTATNGEEAFVAIEKEPPARHRRSR
jgi:CheY-like chemotaxis protein